MKYNNREDVQNLKIKFCNEIENLFKVDETIEFNDPFYVYILEDNEYDSTVTKAPYLCRTLINGKYLTGRTMYGDEFDDLSIYDLDDIVEVAYILDTVIDKSYKIIEDEQLRQILWRSKRL